MGNRSSLLEFLTVKDRPKEGCAIYRTDVALSTWFNTSPLDTIKCPQNHHFQNVEHPNYVSSGWGVLPYVLNSGGSWIILGFIRRFPWPQRVNGFRQPLGDGFGSRMGGGFDVRIGGWFGNNKPPAP
jgi:hypothetical protein